MDDVRLSRLRTGAVAWRLYREGESAQVFVEAYFVATWDEHLRQHHGRLTGEDARPSDHHFALVLPIPIVNPARVDLDQH